MARQEEVFGVHDVSHTRIVKCPGREEKGLPWTRTNGTTERTLFQQSDWNNSILMESHAQREMVVIMMLPMQKSERIVYLTGTPYRTIEQTMVA